MMKKLLALLMALTLVGGIALAETEMVSFDETSAGYEGAWVEEKDASIKVYLPAGYAPNPAFTPQKAENGSYTTIYMSPDFVSTLSISKSPLYLEEGTEVTLDTLLSMYQGTGSAAAIVNINGADWIKVAENEMGNITLLTVDNEFTYTVTFVVINSADQEKAMEMGEAVLHSVTLMKE